MRDDDTSRAAGGTLRSHRPERRVAPRGRPLRKELGQHFLTRPEVCAPLVEFLRPDGGPVVEIGPGAGALTTALLDAGARVIAWEVDPRWAFEVSRRLGPRGLATVLGDARELPWDRLAPGTLVAGNLPYNVATRIVLDLLAATLGDAGRIPRAAFLMQREVVERLLAGPGDPAYGALSVQVAAAAAVTALGGVAPGAFSPPPKVDSAFVGLVPRRSAVTAGEYPRFTALVRAAFARRRKTLRNSLAASLGREAATMLVEAAGLTTSVRAEALDLERFVELLRHADELVPAAWDAPSAAGAVR